MDNKIEELKNFIEEYGHDFLGDGTMQILYADGITSQEHPCIGGTKSSTEQRNH